MDFSDFIVYVDESGDHGLSSIDDHYPVFVLTFCIFRKDALLREISPAVQALKFHFWGHDGVVLHSHEIRKAKNDFNILLNSVTRGRFMSAIESVLMNADFVVVAAVIDKIRLLSRYASPADPYDIALVFCMERLQRLLIENDQAAKRTHVLVECRGRSEDNALELAFRRICDGGNAVGRMPNLEIVFMDKKQNSAGLQIADLVAHPIGRHHIKPDQPNRAYEIVRTKFRRSSSGKIEGYGRKVFP